MDAKESKAVSKYIDSIQDDLNGLLDSARDLGINLDLEQPVNRRLNEIDHLNKAVSKIVAEIEQEQHIDLGDFKYCLLMQVVRYYRIPALTVRPARLMLSSPDLIKDAHEHFSSITEAQIKRAFSQLAKYLDHHKSLLNLDPFKLTKTIEDLPEFAGRLSDGFMLRINGLTDNKAVVREILSRLSYYQRAEKIYKIQNLEKAINETAKDYLQDKVFLNTLHALIYLELEIMNTKNWRVSSHVISKIGVVD